MAPVETRVYENRKPGWRDFCKGLTMCWENRPLSLLGLAYIGQQADAPTGNFYESLLPVVGGAVMIGTSAYSLWKTKREIKKRRDKFSPNVFNVSEPIEMELRDGTYQLKTD